MQTTTDRRNVFVAGAAMLALSALPLSAASPPKKPPSKPPSRTALPKPAGSAGLAAGAGVAPSIRSGGATLRGPGAPTAWIDEANLMPAGSASVAAYVLGWRGATSSEIDVPVLDLAVGLTPRLQFGANIPHVLGSDADGGAVGGLGTSYFSAKIGLAPDNTVGVKLAAVPTFEILGRGVLASLPVETSPLRWGLPFIAEIDRGAGRVFASAGYFSHGGWFAGVGVGAQAAQRVGVSASFSRAWATTDSLATDALRPNDRNEISACVSYAARPQIALFGSVGRTIATTGENGAGMTITGGVSIFAGTATRSQQRTREEVTSLRSGKSPL